MYKCCVRSNRYMCTYMRGNTLRTFPGNARRILKYKTIQQRIVSYAVLHGNNYYACTGQPRVYYYTITLRYA